MARLTTRAPAKINWTLEVLGRRPDGYHEIASVMSTISLTDRLTLVPARAWELSLDGPVSSAVPPKLEDNLVVQAAAALAARIAGAMRLTTPEPWQGWPPPPALGRPFHIRLEKHIPAAAGLGGGSSDAAAILRLLYPMWRKPRALSGAEPVGRAVLHDIAAHVGSDVAFFLTGRTQLARGRGSELQQLGDPAAQWLVVLTPRIAVEHKTASLYGLLSHEQYSDGARSAALAARLLGRQPCVISETDIYNVFEGVAHRAFPRLKLYRDHLEKVAGAPAHLCGAGPSLFSLCSGRTAALEAAKRLRAENLVASAVCPTGHSMAAYPDDTLPQT